MAEEEVNYQNKDIFSMESFLKIVFSYMKRKGKRLMNSLCYKIFIFLLTK